MVRRAQQSGQDPQEFANHMFEHNHIPELVAEIRRGKALAQIVEGATVTDALRQRRRPEEPPPDGTIGDPDRGDRRGRGRRSRRRATQRTTRPTTDPRSLTAGLTGRG